jgi:hypothetical protein
MNWSDFSPYVMPYVIGCSEPLLEQHARMVTIEFCRRTLCDQRLLAEVLTDGTPIVDLVLPADTQLVKIKSVKADGREWPLVDPIRGMEFVRSESPLDFCFTQDNKTLMLYPEQEVDTPVQVVAALMPTLTAASFSDDIGSQFMYDIAPGIIASIKRVPGQPFSNMNESMVHQAQFEGRVRTITAKIGRGQSAAKMRSHVTFL